MSRQLLKSNDRDLRYFDERARTAVLVNPSTQVASIRKGAD